MSEAPTRLDRLCIDTIRTLSIDAVEKANSGHPGLPLGAAPMAYALWQRHLKHAPSAPDWPDRDRFVLSAGHGSMLLYALLHLTGYDLSMEEIERFRQWGSKTPGHPEFGHTPGVECTTGPLGQGSANAVGMAMAERWMARRYNRPGHAIVDHHTWALVSDGDLMEGLSGEAASLAGHLGLGKLIYLYDSNGISLDGPTSLAFSTEDVAKRYEAYGWHVQTVADGDTDLDALDAAIAAARAETARPSLIVVNTTIAYGSPGKAGTAAAHGAPLGPEELRATKRNLGWEWDEPFHVPAEALEHFRGAIARGDEARAAWQARFEAWAAAEPALAEEWRRALAGELPPGWDAELPAFGPEDAQATRQAGGKALNALAPRVPWLVGGDADIGSSTKTVIAGSPPFGSEELPHDAGRNVHFGVREHAMGAIANGMAYHGGLRPYTATFFVFSDYMRPAMRLAALNGLPVVFVFTHDSIGVGEDGPTHQPVEHLAALRCMPNLHVVRPGDPNETSQAWRYALERTDGPTVLVMTRQKLPVLDQKALAPATGLARGGYVLADASADGEDPAAILIATGSELQLALAAHELLSKEGVATRVVSLPCWEAFEAQDAAWREQVLPERVTARLAIEAGAGFGWHRWVGTAGDVLSMERFGASAPGGVLMDQFGFTVKHVVERVRALVGGRVPVR